MFDKLKFIFFFLILFSIKLRGCGISDRQINIVYVWVCVGYFIKKILFEVLFIFEGDNCQLLSSVRIYCAVT